MRRSGVLLPVSSIPSRYGIGTFSKEAYEFVDFLESAGQSLWQILPLGPTGYGDSPYQSFSTFAGNPYMIDLEALIEEGWLTREECDACDFGADRESIDYEKLYRSRFGLLQKAFERAEPEKMPEFQEFVKENAYWLPDYALYMAIKDSQGSVCWTEWEEALKLRRPEALKKQRKKLKEQILCYEFQQFLFACQWQELKAYANDRGIRIIGDIPIYVAMDSADAWAGPELFQLDEACTPVAVAGCPPDGFSATGQLWGNPLYRWEYHRETGYTWWLKRIDYCFRLYDIVRIDHFRGFDEYYSIPYGDQTAEFGHWEKGPGYELFRTLKQQLGDKEIIAEDLGFLTKSVRRLLARSGYPGMKVLQFAFDSREESDYLPHNYGKNCVVYTGTHDNDTTRHWYETLTRADKRLAKEYLDIHTAREAEWVFIRAALSSVADTAVIPMQDYLGLGEKARINTPSTLGNNWVWRMKEDAYTPELAARIRKLTKLYGRIPRKLL